VTVLNSEEVSLRLDAACKLAEDTARRIADNAASPRARFKGWADWVTAIDVAIEEQVGSKCRGNSLKMP
jgi:hypothetical protein